MPTPTPDKISIFYASKGLGTGGAPTARNVGLVTNAMTFTVSNISEETGFWNGAVGYFLNTTTVALRGQAFHVRDWNKESNILTLSTPLPTLPVSGDKFYMYVGGNQTSNQEVLCMLAGGKQPEIEPIAPTYNTGVTIKKISPLLGEGTLTLYYTNSGGVKTIMIRMGTSGDYGPGVVLTHNVQNLVLYTKDLLGYIIVDVEFDKLSTSSSRTDTFTLTTPKGNMLPNYEGYETNDGVGRTRYHLFPMKNKATDPEDVVSGMMFWSGRPEGSNTTPTEGNKRSRPFMRCYSVFHVGQVDDPDGKFKHILEAKIETDYEAAERIFETSGADIRIGGNRAFYIPTENYLRLPHSGQFENEEERLATAFHELGHWADRNILGTELTSDKKNPDYAYGELVAELTACFLCQACGVPNDFDNHESYIASWIRAMKNDTSYIWRASKDASKIADELLKRAGIKHDEEVAVA